MDEQAVTAETLGQALDRGVRHAVLAGDLAMAGAADLAVEDGLEKVGSAEPVADGEGL